MQAIQGIVTIVQEGRFQVMDDEGVGHHFLLSHRAAVEPEQLPMLQRNQSRVRVWYQNAPDLIGHVALRIDLLADNASIMPRAKASSSMHAQEATLTGAG